MPLRCHAAASSNRDGEDLVRLEKRCRKCSSAMTERRCETCGSGPSWGFVLEAGQKAGHRRRIVRRGFQTKAEARSEARRIEADLADRSFVEPSTTTVGSWLTHWLELAEARLRPSTMDGYRQITTHHLLAEFGDIRLQDLTRHEIEALYARKRAEGLASGTLRNIHALLRKALADATERQLLRTNPAQGAFNLRVEREEMKVWDPAQLTTFLRAVESHRLFPLMRLAAMTGLRRGELLGLRWEDVDLDSAVLHVRRSLVRGSGGPSLGEPKTRRSRRSVDLDRDTVTALRSWRPRQAEEAIAFNRADWMHNNVHGLVFTREDGLPLDPDAVSHTFNKLIKRAGLARIRFHDIRHTHATLLLKAGESLHVVSRRLGHSTAAFTADTYSHVLPGEGAAAVERLASMLE